jgi:hypothetical membrane protein
MQSQGASASARRSPRISQTAARAPSYHTQAGRSYAAFHSRMTAISEGAASHPRVSRLRRNYFLLFGPIAAALFVFGTLGLAVMIPGYSQVRQTVSEIGEVGSPARIPFTIMLCSVAVCILIFASAVRRISVEAGRSSLAAYLIGFMALSAAGVGIFAYPHPLHNVFGISELVGYQAPLFFALTWGRHPQAKRVDTFSWIMFGLVWVAIIVNLSPFDRKGVAWAYVRPAYGLAQRALFLEWFGWSATLGVLLFEGNSKWPRASAS